MARDTTKVDEETNGTQTELKIISRDEYLQLQLNEINQKLTFLINSLPKQDIPEENKK